MTKSALQLILDAAAGKPIYQRVFNAMCSEDAVGEVQKIIDTSGYDLSPESLESAFRAATVDRRHSIAMFGGKYIFTEPSNVKDKALLVNPTTGVVSMLGERAVARHVTDSRFTWMLTKRRETYTVTFDVGFTIDHLPEDHSFEGTRDPGSVQVKAFQKIPEPAQPDAPDDPLPDPGVTGGPNKFALVAALLCVGGILGLASALYCHQKNNGRFQDHRVLFRNGRERARVLIELEQLNPRLATDYPSVRPNVDNQISNDLHHWLQQHPDIKSWDLTTPEHAHQLAEMRESVNKHALEQLRRGMEAHLDAAADLRYHGVTEVAGMGYRETVEPIVEKVTSREFEACKPAMANYSGAQLDVVLQDGIVRDAYYEGEKYREAASMEGQAAEKAERDRQGKERAKTTVEEELRRKDLTEQRRHELETERGNLETDIEDLKGKEEEAKRKRKDAEDRVDDEETKKRNAKEEGRRKREESGRHAGKVFGK